MSKLSTNLTDDVKKFLRSEFAEKILKKALLNGQNAIKYGKDYYDIKFLLGCLQRNRDHLY